MVIITNFEAYGTRSVICIWIKVLKMDRIVGMHVLSAACLRYLFYLRILNKIRVWSLVSYYYADCKLTELVIINNFMINETRGSNAPCKGIRNNLCPDESGNLPILIPISLMQ